MAQHAARAALARVPDQALTQSKDPAMLPIGYLIKRAQEGFRINMDRALKPLGLTASSYAALYHLRAQELLSNAALARACWVTAQTMHRISAELLERGLILQDSTQGRAILFRLSETGREALTLAEEAVEHVEAVMIEGLDAQQREQLQEALKRCCASLEALERGER